MKKLLLVSAMAFTVLLLAGCGKTTEVAPTDEVVSVTETSDVTKKEATKEQCFEIVKYGMDVALAQMKGETKTAEDLAQKAMALEEKYNLEGVEFENTCEKYMTDAEFVQMVQEESKKMQ